MSTVQAAPGNDPLGTDPGPATTNLSRRRVLASAAAVGAATWMQFGFTTEDGWVLRPAGAGHNWSPLVFGRATGENLLLLDLRPHITQFSRSRPTRTARRSRRSGPG